jgi:hypothetical protein
MEGITQVVLDTNVLVAAAYNPGSASRRIVEACLTGELAAVLKGWARSSDKAGCPVKPGAGAVDRRVKGATAHRGVRPDSTGEDQAMRLYRAYSVVNGYHADDGHVCDGVRVGWFVFDRRGPLAPYEGLVAGYAGRDACLESVADELFTRDQVERLRRHLRTRHGVALHAQEVALPVRGLRVGLSGVAPREDHGEEDWLLFDEAGYALPFLAMAFVELRPGGDVLDRYLDFAAGVTGSRTGETRPARQGVGKRTKPAPMGWTPGRRRAA